MSGATAASMKKGLWPLLLLGVFALALTQLQPAGGVEVTQAQAMVQQGALLIDVREPAEYAAGHAPGARLIPLSELKGRLSELAAYKDKPIVVMCHSGRRSAHAAELMREAGYTQVSSMRGGITAWSDSGLKVVRGDS